MFICCRFLRQLWYFIISQSLCQQLFHFIFSHPLFFLAVSLFIISFVQSVVKNFFELFRHYFLPCERRRRDLNPRAAINDLHPFQGCPFGQLGYFSEWINIFCCNHITKYDWAEKMGFEPMRPFGQTVFKTASLWPLRYFSVFIFTNALQISAKMILAPCIPFCQQLFYIFFNFF